MKDNAYVKQFFCEGFGRFLFLTPVRYLNKYVKNESIIKVITGLLIIIYIVIMIYLAIFIFNITYPF